MILDIKLTPTQRRMLELLSDEQPHNRFALQKCLNDELGDVSGIKAHLTHLRKKIIPYNYNIRSELLAGEYYYRLIKTSPISAE